MARKGSNKVIVAVYSHPEYYPPTLNAIANLAENYEEVIVVCRNVLKSEWEYAPNVRIHPTGEYLTIREAEAKSTAWKVSSFLRYTLTLLKEIRGNRPKLVLLYDAIPLLSFSLSKAFSNTKPFVWYHNHDVIDIGTVRKYSVGYFASKNEK